jgi:hypothetical protein
LVDGLWLFNGLWSFDFTFKLGLGSADVLFDELEVFNVSDQSISVLVSIVENLFGSSTWNGRLQEFPGVVTESLELLCSHFSVSSFGHLAGPVHDLETHFGTMSLEEEVTLNKKKILPVI